MVYGAAATGGAVARGFGAEGAWVYVGDRTATKASATCRETALVEMEWADFIRPIETAVCGNPRRHRRGGGVRRLRPGPDETAATVNVSAGALIDP